ncbi:MAG: hypothetical protein RR942_15875 [Romboutsia sp.]
MINDILVLIMCPVSIGVQLILGIVLNLDNKIVVFLSSAYFFASGILVLIQMLGFANIGSKLPLMKANMNRLKVENADIKLYIRYYTQF